MTTLEELINKFGIEKNTAQRVIDQYKAKIGTEHGEFEITDITYLGNQEREIELTCKKCNTKIIKHFCHDKNKWRDLIHQCPECRKRRRKEAQEKKEKDCRAKIGEKVGDFCITKWENGKYTLKCNKCGTEKTARLSSIKKGTVNGHCTKHFIQKIKYDESYIGRKNNYLTIIAFTKDKENKKAFLCKCDCGGSAVVKPILWENGEVKSCGCYQENRSVGKDENKRIKGIYHGMKERCCNQNNKDYYNYGGRGIKICDKWLNNINDFIEWSLSHGYDNRLTIDRINVDGDYEPDNCRWVTYKLQNMNRRPRGKKCHDQQRTKKDARLSYV